ncbi:AsmA family protein [Acidiferrobacter sp.]
MKKRTRLIAIAAGLLVVAVAVAVALLPGILALNQVKTRIAQILSQTTGRPVTIGKLSVTLFPWLGVRVNGATLGNAPGFGARPLARVARVDIEVRVLPLFRRQIVLRRVILTGLYLNLDENRAGATNWATLIHSPAVKPRSPAAARAERHEAPAFVLLHAAGLSLRDALIRYRDARTGSADTLSGLHLRVGAITPGQPVAVGLHGLLKIAGHPAFPFRLSTKARYQAPRLTLSSLRFSIATLKVLGRVHIQDTHGAPRARGHLTVPPFAPRPLLAALGFPYQPRAATVLKQASAAVSFHWSPAALRLAPLRLTLDRTTITGRVTRMARPLSYQAQLAIDRLRPLPYLPAPSTPAAPPPSPSPGPTAPAHGAAFNAPLTATLSCGRLRAHGLLATNLHAVLQAAGGQVSLKPMTMDLYQGHFAGAVEANLRPSPATWRLQAQLVHVEVSQVLSALHVFPAFSGALDARAHLHGSGVTLAAAKQTLSGRLTAAIPNGMLRGVDLDLIAKDPKALAGAHKAHAARGTRFSGLHASATVGHGVVHMNALTLHTTRAVIHGHGDFVLATDSVNSLLEVALPSGFVIPVRVAGPPGHIRFNISLNRLFSDSSPNNVGSTLKTLGGALKHAFGLH